MSIKNKWLIKSDSKILGPYSFEQVEDLLLKRQVSILDEIKDMPSRWLHIREKNEFKEAVDTLRKQNDEKVELTQTIQTSLTKTLTAVNSEETITAQNQLDQIQAIHDDKIELPVEIPKNKNKSKSLHYSKTNLETKKSNNYLKYLVLFLLFGAISAAFYGYYLNTNNAEKALVQQIKKYQLFAQNEKAVDLFKKMNASTQDRVLVDIIPLWMTLEKSNAVSPQRLIELFSTGKITGNERKSEYQLYKFNKAFNLGDFQNAKDALVKAYEFDSASSEVKENDAVFNFATQKYLESAKKYKDLYDKSFLGRHLYGYVLSLINDKTSDQSENLKNLTPVLHDFILKHYDYTKELSLLGIYILKKYSINNVLFLEDMLNQLRSFPIQFTRYFKHPYLVSREMQDWKYSWPVIQELFYQLDPINSSLYNVQYFLENNDFEKVMDVLKNVKNLDEIDVNSIKVYVHILRPDLIKEFESDDKVYIFAQLAQILDKERKNPDLKNTKALWQPLQNEKGLIGSWAKIKNLDPSFNQNQITNIIQSDKMYSDDFLPYLKYKAIFNE